MSLLKHFKYFLWIFSHFKVPLIGFVKPSIYELNEERLVIKIPLKRRTKNHLNSMYFGALAIGADLAAGLHGFYHAKKAHLKISLAFKSFSAQFLKRPETDVYFICSEGNTIQEMIVFSSENKERCNKPILIKAFTNYPANPELVAEFILELSIKVIYTPPFK